MKQLQAVHAKETPSQADTLKKFLYREIATKNKQECNHLATTKKQRDILKI